MSEERNLPPEPVPTAPPGGSAAAEDVAAPGDGSTAAAPARAAGEPSGLRLLWLGVVVIVLDQVTKTLVLARFELYERLPVLPVFELTRLHNPGAAFSLLATASGWQRWFFVTLAFAVSAGIVFWLSRIGARSQALLATGLALILGGALGNVIDRLQHGYVVDFLHFHWFERWWFPAFNVADTAITVGAGLLILDSILESRREAAARRSAP